MTTHLSFGDVPAWIALVLSLLALLRNWRSSKWEKQSAEAADRSANEAARANLIAQRALDQRAAQSEEESAAGVRWRIEKGGGASYVLRNTGTSTADHVYVDEARAPGINRRLPSDSVIQPGAGHEMLLQGSWQHPLPTELYVRWAGHDAWVAVPLPG